MSSTTVSRSGRSVRPAASAASASSSADAAPSAAPANPSTSFPPYLQSRSSQILSQLLYHAPSHRVFNGPINVTDPSKDFYAPNYIEIVGRTPLHLKLLRKRLENNEYSTADEFANEIRILYDNAMKYNPPGNWIHDAAAAALAAFEKEWKIALSMSEDEYYAPNIADCDGDDEEDEEEMDAAGADADEDVEELADLHGETEEDIEALRNALAEMEEREKRDRIKRKKEKKDKVKKEKVKKETTATESATETAAAAAPEPIGRIGEASPIIGENGDAMPPFTDSEGDEDGSAAGKKRKRGRDDSAAVTDTAELLNFPMSESESEEEKTPAQAMEESGEEEEENEENGSEGSGSGSEEDSEDGSYDSDGSDGSDSYDAPHIDENDLPRQKDIETAFRKAQEAGLPPPVLPRSREFRPARMPAEDSESESEDEEMDNPFADRNDSELTIEELKIKYAALTGERPPKPKKPKPHPPGWRDGPDCVDDENAPKNTGYPYKTSRLGDRYQALYIPDVLRTEEERQAWIREFAWSDGEKQELQYEQKEIPAEFIAAREQYIRAKKLREEQARMDAIARRQMEARRLAQRRAQDQSDSENQSDSEHQSKGPKLTPPISSLANGMSVVVIGAGIAGLAAAREAQRMGFSVTVLEARGRVGGRMFAHSVGQSHSSHAPSWQALELAPTSQPSHPVDLGGEMLSNVLDNPLLNAIEDGESVIYAVDTPTAEYSISSIHPRIVTASPFAVPAESEPVAALPAVPQPVSFYPSSSPFLQSLARSVPIHYNAVVKKILYSSTGVTVRCLDSKSYRASAVIVTVPLGVLKQEGEIVFEPELPQWKKEAIGCVSFKTVNKVYLEFDRSFWPDSNPNIRLVDTPSEFRFFRNVTSVRGVPSLVAVCEGNKLEDLSPVQLEEEILSALRPVFGSSLPKITRLIASAWGSDQFSAGSYSALEIPSDANARDFHGLKSPFEALAAPVSPRLLFAGEHTHASLYGSIEGAYLSGIREARRLADSLLHSRSLGGESATRAGSIPAEEESSTACCLCQSLSTSNDKHFHGPLIDFEGRIVHKHCIQYVPGVRKTVHFKWTERDSAAASPSNALTAFSSSITHSTQWWNVTRAIERSFTAACALCNSAGASIGCHADRCRRNYHYFCACSGTKWNFQLETQGKLFYCPEHRDSAVAERLFVQRIRSSAGVKAAGGSAVSIENGSAASHAVNAPVVKRKHPETSGGETNAEKKLKA